MLSVFLEHGLQGFAVVHISCGYFIDSMVISLNVQMLL